MEAPPLINEAQRLETLRSHAILDTEPEADFDGLVKLASQLCDAPIALVSLVDEHRQWFKAKQGLDACETPRRDAFCAHAILGSETMVVWDALEDDRFRDNPLVTGGPRIRFYAGTPLTTRDGHNLGTLCVIDAQPRRRDGFDTRRREALQTLASQVVRLLELRRSNALLADALARVRVLEPLVPVCAWCRSVRDDDNYWSSIDRYLRRHAGVRTTHGICPTCEADFARS
jgi:GAF domain-containing protein